MQVMVSHCSIKNSFDSLTKSLCQYRIGRFVQCIIIKCLFLTGKQLVCWDSDVVKTDAQLTIKSLK